MVILALYINIESMNSADAGALMQKSVESLTKSFPSDVHVVALPTRTSSTRLECIYPKFVVVEENEMVKMKEIVSELMQKLSVINPEESSKE